MSTTTTDPELEAELGEMTGGQGRIAVIHRILGGSDEEFAGSIPPPTYATYRAMRADPTVAMARAASFAPIKAAQWRCVGADGASEEAKALVDKFIREHRSAILRLALFGRDYGWMPSEKVWEIDASLWRVAKLKPLRPEWTQAMVSEATGMFLGLKNKAAYLPADKSFVYTYDQELEDPYGRPIGENLRAVFGRYITAQRRLAIHINRVTGIIPMIQYPEGKSRDATGSRVDNFQIAMGILRDLPRGEGIAFPNVIVRWAKEMLERGGDPGKLKAWVIDILAIPTGHMAELLSVLLHLEKLLVRGYLIPERAVTEATLAGSRADSVTAGDLALTIAQDCLDDILRQVNRYIIAPMLRVNFGDAAKESVRIEAEPLSGESRAFLKTLMGQVLANPANADVTLKVLDLDESLNQLGVPVDREALDEMDDVADYSGAPGMDGADAQAAADAAAGLLGGGPAGAPASPVGDQSAATATNDLRATVGGSQAILALQEAYYGNTIPREAAMSNAVLVFGFTEQEAADLFPETEPDAPGGADAAPPPGDGAAPPELGPDGKPMPMMGPDGKPMPPGAGPKRKQTVRQTAMMDEAGKKFSLAADSIAQVVGQLNKPKTKRVVRDVNGLIERVIEE